MKGLDTYNFLPVKPDLMKVPKVFKTINLFESLGTKKIYSLMSPPSLDFVQFLNKNIMTKKPDYLNYYC